MTGESVDRGNRTPATLVDVAARAGVSLKTASRALNGEPHVADGTRRRVVQAAEAMDFRLNGPASMLRRGIRSTVVGFVTGDLANPFYAAIASGLEQELRGRGMQLVVASTDEDPTREQELVDELVSRQVRALVLVSTRASHVDMDRLQERGVRVVFVDRPPVGLEADSVLLDSAAGARSAVEHLLAHGHRRIGFVGDYSRLATHLERLTGFGDALDCAGVTGWRRWVREDRHDAASARSGMRDLLSLAEPPTAVFTSNNRVTIGALTAVRGLDVPPALVGFDDFDLADLLGVTVVSHDPGAMGREAARLALDPVGPGRERPAKRVVVPTRLVPRGSGEVSPGVAWR
ncbi:LacI family DNA-binding transcriptional regulator [Frigoribacterium sp. 2-23]|uniref:LacI family DNA-binding transcriptional regulator n=1 Tax=Frigoribacterium sp. 2-23 TaxID=3415006 RepID=UPI003C6FF9C8